MSLFDPSVADVAVSVIVTVPLPLAVFFLTVNVRLFPLAAAPGAVPKETRRFFKVKPVGPPIDWRALSVVDAFD